MRRAGTRIPGRLLAAAAAAGLLVAGQAQAAFAELPSPTALSTASTQPSVAPSPAAASGPLITGIEGSTALWFLLSLVLIVIAAWMLPLLIDLLSAYGAQRKTRAQLQALIDAVAGTPRDGFHGPGPAGPRPVSAGPQAAGGAGQPLAGGDPGMSLIPEGELMDLLSALSQPPSGTPGLARVLMAFAIVSVIAVLSVALVFSGAPDAAELRKTIVVGLIGVLATIVGFYFGSRTASEAQAKGPAGPQPPPPGSGAAPQGGGVPPQPGVPSQPGGPPQPAGGAGHAPGDVAPPTPPGMVRPGL
ncbi:MAG: hypothetical protein M3075_10905 [Candidatus Dormibacteraeota bacterium]|nr:hypothetical protein [Candidatus Dormibacteraeota bacterium]